MLFQCFIDCVIQSQIDQIVGQKLSDQKLCRYVIYLFLSFNPSLPVNRLLGQIQQIVINLFITSSCCNTLNLLFKHNEPPHKFPIN